MYLQYYEDENGKRVYTFKVKIYKKSGWKTVKFNE